MREESLMCTWHVMSKHITRKNKKNDNKYKIKKVWKMAGIFCLWKFCELRIYFQEVCAFWLSLNINILFKLEKICLYRSRSRCENKHFALKYV